MMSDLLNVILSQYALPLYGIHGLSHWARVLENGRRLSKVNGARLEVVELFAILHDSKRDNEGIDYRHGPLGAEYAVTLRSNHLKVSNGDFDLLYFACAHHTEGLTEADVTVQTCWDADRLDLGRVGIKPWPRRLCTDAARDPALISWADGRARARFVPDLIAQEWGIEPDGKGSFTPKAK
jgi:uncharacterized protein